MIEALDSCIDETKNLEPLYENLYNSSKQQQQHYNRKADLKRDEKILFELSRAADEIMEVSWNYYKRLAASVDEEEEKLKQKLKWTINDL